MGEPTHTSRDRAVMLLATGGGLGNARWLPGTVGSVWGPPLVWLWQLSGLPPWSNAVLGVLLFLVGIPICGRAAELIKAKDPSRVVFDEIAAFPWVFLFVPVTLTSALYGFLWFRLFDIVKPWPCIELDRLPGGFGIMADDAAAAVYASAALIGTMAMWNGLT